MLLSEYFLNLTLSMVIFITVINEFGSVIVATGLIALVDDCIKRHFHSSRSRAHVPAVSMEFVNPKTMMEHVFKRRGSGGEAKLERSGGGGERSSPLRWQSRDVAAY